MRGVILSTLNSWQQSCVIGLLCLMVIIGRMAFDIYIPALPVIQHYFLTTAHQIQLSISLFSLGFGVSQLFYGPCSDYFGRRIILFLGLSIFIVGSIWAYYALNIQQLIFARFVSGFGVGAGVVIARAISRDLFDGKKLANIAALQTLVLTFALFIAPIIGSYLLHWFSWRADFLFLVILGLLCFLLFLLLLPETNLNRAQGNLNTAFKNYFNIMSSYQFVSNVLVASFSFAGLVIYFQLTPFIFAKQYGISPMSYSWLSLAIAFTYIVGTISMKRQLKKYSMERIVFHGIIAMLISGLLMLFMETLKLSSLAGILLFSMGYIYGLRLILPAATANCLSPFKKNAGAAAALLGAILMGISALVSFLVSLLDFNQILLLGLTYVILAVAACLIVSLRR